MVSGDGRAGDCIVWSTSRTFSSEVSRRRRYLPLMMLMRSMGFEKGVHPERNPPGLDCLRIRWRSWHTRLG